MALTDEQPAARRRPDATPHGHGLRLDRWDPDAEAQVEAWLRSRTDPDFRRWNTPLTLVSDLAGARAVLRRQAADATCEPFRITDAESGTTLGHVGVNMIDHTFRTARVGYWDSFAVLRPSGRG